MMGEPAPGRGRTAPVASNEDRVASHACDVLGAPFPVHLMDSVTVRHHPDPREATVTIPDLAGLIREVVRARVRHPRKMNGAEIRFVRRAVDARIERLAPFLYVTSEMLARYECDDAVMPPGTEALLRSVVHAACTLADPGAAFEQAHPSDPIDLEPRDVEDVLGFLRFFLGVRIEAASGDAATPGFAFRFETPDREPGGWREVEPLFGPTH